MDEILREMEKHAAKCWRETEPTTQCANTTCSAPASERCMLHVTMGNIVLDIAFCPACYWQLHRILEGWG